MTDEQKKTLDFLEAQCAKREYCRKDIMEKAMKRLDYDKDAAEEVVSRLVDEKFVDDERYAAAFAREKASLNGWGPVKIKFALSAKGITGKAADDAISEIDAKAAQKRLDSMVLSKFKSLEGDEQWKIKLLKFLLSRGYEYDQIKESIDRITENE
jgi:regulatory protein